MSMVASIDEREIDQLHNEDESNGVGSNQDQEFNAMALNACKNV